ncbi:cytochrome c [bacterium]|nr:cytochrome c [bacterium]
MKLLIAIISLGFILISFQQPDPLSESIERGKEVYGDFCVTCHLSSGKGMPGIFPPLAESDYLLTKRNESIKAIKKGQKGEITVNGVKYNNIMAPLGLDDEEVADVMNFILNSWGNESKEMVTEEEVSKI